ncbi:MAG: alpha/beta fold hydrolase [Flavobacteriales bacterium]
MNDAILNHDDAGNGLPLLLIHGFPHDRRLWGKQLTGLQDTARVIIPDLRGFGASGDPAGTMTMDDHAADLHALLEELGIQKVVVAGLSMGGYIALAFLARYPDVVKGLILSNTRATADSDEAREGREDTARKVMTEGVPLLARAMLPKMLSQERLSTQPGLSSSIKTMMAEQRPAGVVAALRGMAARPDRTPMLSTIRVPTLIITGSIDTVIPPSESEAMARAIPGSKLLVIPNVAHLSNVEAPDAFNSAVRVFMAELKEHAIPA